MANPRLLKKRVGSIKNISKITRALEMVSASKVQKAQKEALNAKPYARLVYELVSSLSDAKLSEIPLMRTPEVIINNLFILVSTNRGLAGSLNTNLFKFMNSYLKSVSESKHFFVTIGKKGRSLAAAKGSLIADFSDEKDISSIVSAVVKIVVQGYVNEEYDAVYIIYSDFINALNQEPRIKQLLPITKLKLDEEGAREHFEIMGEAGKKEVEPKSEKVYSYEPDPVAVLGSLLPFYLEIQVAESLYESEASEHSARMIAMKNATESAKELSEGLLLEYNKARQSMITTEISDITTAQLSIEE